MRATHNPFKICDMFILWLMYKSVGHNLRSCLYLELPIIPLKKKFQYDIFFFFFEKEKTQYDMILLEGVNNRF